MARRITHKAGAALAVALLISAADDAQAQSMLGGELATQMSAPAAANAIQSGNGGYAGNRLYRFNRQEPWLHGSYQEMPAYGGQNAFRPYNYKHVFSQTVHAVRHGAPRSMPYSQQFWNRYRTHPAPQGQGALTSYRALAPVAPGRIAGPGRTPLRPRSLPARPPQSRRSIVDRPLFPLP